MNVRADALLVGVCVVAAVALLADIVWRPPGHGHDKVLCSFQGEAYALIGDSLWRVPAVDDDCAPLKREPEEPVG